MGVRVAEQREFDKTVAKARKIQAALTNDDPYGFARARRRAWIGMDLVRRRAKQLSREHARGHESDPGYRRWFFDAVFKLGQQRPLTDRELVRWWVDVPDVLRVCAHLFAPMGVDAEDLEYFALSAEAVREVYRERLPKKKRETLAALGCAEVFGLLLRGNHYFHLCAEAAFRKSSGVPLEFQWTYAIPRHGFVADFDLDVDDEPTPPGEGSPKDPHLN